MATIEERIAEVLTEHLETYDSDCGTYFGCSCGWDNDSVEHNDGYVEHVAAEVVKVLAGGPRSLDDSVSVANCDTVETRIVSDWREVGMTTAEQIESCAACKHDAPWHANWCPVIRPMLDGDPSERFSEEQYERAQRRAPR